MKLIVKSYAELTKEELYDILNFRAEIFVVEQNCPYQDVDYKDQDAYHLWYEESGKIIAYLRVLNRGVRYDTVTISRVLSKTEKRRTGLGTKIMLDGIRIAREKYNADIITISAQLYAKSFYEGVGFYQTTEPYLEDDIPHIQMKLDLTK